MVWNLCLSPKKFTFQTICSMYTLADQSLDRVNVNEYLSYVENGLKVWWKRIGLKMIIKIVGPAWHQTTYLLDVSSVGSQMSDPNGPTPWCILRVYKASVASSSKAKCGETRKWQAGWAEEIGGESRNRIAQNTKQWTITENDWSVRGFFGFF